MTLSDRAAARLVIAGRLLQASPREGGWGLRIQRRDGESYPLAVMREISALAEGDQARLRGLVDWVESYEREEGRQRPPERP